MAKVLIMGVSGSGKSIIGQRVAARMGAFFIEGDDFHPEHNVSKMASGQPLHDDDRIPWLLALRREVVSYEHCVLACSALKEQYRTILSQSDGIDTVIFLRGSYELIRTRLASRKGHFMPTDLLQSQFDDLEVPKDGIVVDIHRRPEQIIDHIVKLLTKKQVIDEKV